MAKTTTPAQTDEATTDTTTARNDINTVVLPAVKEEKPAYGSPDSDGHRWAQIARPDGVKVFVITKEGRQVNNTAPTAAEAKKNIQAYLAD